jgi:hypothetical protein
MNFSTKIFQALCGRSPKPQGAFYIDSTAPQIQKERSAAERKTLNTGNSFLQADYSKNLLKIKTEKEFSHERKHKRKHQPNRAESL